MEWDGHAVDTVNAHFLEVSVSALRAAYNKIIEDLDDDKTLTLASIQTTQIIPVGVFIIARFSTHKS
jgi:hypothetical protein